MRAAQAATPDKITAIQASQVATDRKIAELQSDLRSVGSDMYSLRADVASDIITLRKEIGERITGLHRTVVEYHSVVIGHGFLITELEGRVRRLEQNAGLSPVDAH